MSKTEKRTFATIGIDRKHRCGSPPQWRLLQPLSPRSGKQGCSTDRLQILNGLLYFVDSGCAWRLLPKEFGAWETVHGSLCSWRRAGLWIRIHPDLRRLVGRQVGRTAQPTAAILDSQSVRSADHSGSRGLDPAKKLNSRTRHALVDPWGCSLLGVMLCRLGWNEKTHF
jgi:putative transposase